MNSSLLILMGTVLAVVVVTPVIVGSFLRDVEAGEIRLVSWLSGTCCAARRAPISR